MLEFTFPKLPLPSTLRNWKSSTVYFLKRGIVVAGGVTRPLHGSVLGQWSSHGSRPSAVLLLRAGLGDAESVLLLLLHEGPTATTTIYYKATLSWEY
jgi:hypothetical protein